MAALDQKVTGANRELAQFQVHQSLFTARRVCRPLFIPCRKQAHRTIEYSAFPCGSRWFSQPTQGPGVFAAADRTELFNVVTFTQKNWAL